MASQAEWAGLRRLFGVPRGWVFMLMLACCPTKEMASQAEWAGLRRLFGAADAPPWRPWRCGSPRRAPTRPAGPARPCSLRAPARGAQRHEPVDSLYLLHGL